VSEVGGETGFSGYMMKSKTKQQEKRIIGHEKRLPKEFTQGDKNCPSRKVRNGSLGGVSLNGPPKKDPGRDVCIVKGEKKKVPKAGQKECTRVNVKKMQGTWKTPAAENRKTTGCALGGKKKKQKGGVSGGGQRGQQSSEQVRHRPKFPKRALSADRGEGDEVGAAAVEKKNWRKLQRLPAAKRETS